MKQYVIVFWCSVSRWLMTKYLYMCLLAICILSLKKCLLKSFDHFKSINYLFIKLKVFFLYSGHRSLITYVTWKYFLPFLGWFFTFWWFPLKHKHFSLNFHEIQFIYFFLTACVFLAMFTKLPPNMRSWRFTSMSSSKSFIVFGLMFRPMTHF